MAEAASAVWADGRFQKAVGEKAVAVTGSSWLGSDIGGSSLRRKNSAVWESLILR